MKREIPVVFACDNNFVLQTAVAICSLMEKGLKDREVLFFILTNGEISKEGLEIFHIVEDRYSNCILKIITVDNQIFSGVKIQIARLTESTLYRLLLPQILEEYQYCLYLDADILVMDDISELIDTDMSGMYLAGVIDKGVKDIEGHAGNVGLPDLDGYINAGVVKMNLELLREHGKVKEFLELVNNNYLLNDQDVLNKSCYGQIKFLSEEYNYFARYVERASSIRILHLTGGMVDRPWLNDRARDAALWWEYAAVFQQSPIFRRIYQEVQKISRERSFHYMIDRCKEYQSVYIWGYTKHSCELLDGLLRNQVCRISGFIDSNPDKQKLVYRGYRVLSPEAVKYKPSCLVINTAQGRRESVNTMLKAKGFDEKDVLQFYAKPLLYYQVLDEKYFAEEFRDLLLKVYGIRR